MLGLFYAKYKKMILQNIKSVTELSGFYIIYKGSALAETPKERGLNHLVEHLICKSIEKLEPVFYKYAINYNAITSDNYVVYYINGLEEYISKLKYMFFEEVTKKHLFSEDAVLHEKKIILEEFNNSFSDNLTGHRYNMFRKYFDYYSAIGDSNVISQSTSENINVLYERQYQEPFMIINVSKDTSFLLEETSTVHSVSPNHHFLDSYKEIKFEINSNYKNVEYPKNAENTVIMHFNRHLIPNNELPLSQFINHILCGDLQKPIFSILRNKYGLCYFANLSDYCFDNHHINIFYSEASLCNVDKINSIVCDTLSSQKSYISKSAFNKAKTFFKIQKKIQLINRFNNVRDLLYNNIFRDDNLELITIERVKAHYEKYYVKYKDNNIFTNS